MKRADALLAQPDERKNEREARQQRPAHDPERRIKGAKEGQGQTELHDPSIAQTVPTLWLSWKVLRKGCTEIFIHIFYTCIFDTHIL